MPKNENFNNLGGITGKNRELLNLLYKEAKIPFNTEFAANILNLNKKRTKDLINLWVKRNWLVRIKKGLYMSVPLGGMRPDAVKEDPWVVANVVFSPCYIGGWSAGEYWGMTDQIFNDIVVYTTKKVALTKMTIQGTRYLIKMIDKKKYFALKPVWRGQAKIMVSDPSRMIIDILNDPKTGGGIRNVLLMIKEYFNGKDKNDDLLIEYLSRFKNRVLYKRLGYLIELNKIDAARVLEICRKNISSGFSKLDPSIAKKGRIMRRWNLIINASLRGVIE